uniref:DDE-type integrase/transposase/recombinase n=1 Tax=Pectinatus frisingensis TaxID=865 RepID=UPI0018C6AC48
MTKSYQICCPKCNNHQNFYRYGKDKDGNQKYLCRVCGHQFVPDANATGKSGRPRIRSYPICPICGKAMFLHHEHKYYSNYQCGDKKCGHSLFVPKQAAITASAMSKLSGKTNFKLMPTLNFDSDEWHANETVVKIRGMKYYLWLVVDSETRFVLGFHLSKYRDSPQAFSLLNSIKHLGKPRAVVTDRYSAYKIPVKTVLNVKHIRVHSFSDDIT